MHSTTLTIHDQGPFLPTSAPFKEFKLLYDVRALQKHLAQCRQELFQRPLRQRLGALRAIVAQLRDEGLCAVPERLRAHLMRQTHYSTGAQAAQQACAPGGWPGQMKSMFHHGR